MRRPEPKKHSECEQCLEVKPLLMPVDCAPGFPMITWSLLCKDCRINSDQDTHPMVSSGWSLKYSHHKYQREAYKEWLEVEFDSPTPTKDDMTTPNQSASKNYEK